MTDPNPHLSPRSKYLDRQMTAWSYDDLKALFEGDENFALYLEEADHEAVFFYAHGRFWLFNHLPTSEVHSAAPEVIIDRIGAAAEKEPGAEPVLMHRDELPNHVRLTVESVEEDPPEHPYEELERTFDTDDGTEGDDLEGAVGDYGDLVTSFPRLYCDECERFVYVTWQPDCRETAYYLECECRCTRPDRGERPDCWRSIVDFVDDGLRADGGIAVGSYDDLAPREDQPVDRNPSLSCRICGDSYKWQDYWKDRILSQNADPDEVPLWCDECEEEIEELRRRRSENADLSEWECRQKEGPTDGV